MSEIKSIQHLQAEEATKQVSDALTHFPDYLCFAVGEHGGFVTMHSRSPERDNLLKAQIVASLRQDKGLHAFFTEIVGKI